MIEGAEKDVRLDIIQKMVRSDYIFYLTGSYYFGTAIESSDYDFFTSSGCEGFLIGLGFRECPVAYKDTQTIIVYRHESGIDVQIVEDVLLKNEAQKYIYMLVEDFRGIKKSKVRSIWCLVYSILNDKGR